MTSKSDENKSGASQDDLTGLSNTTTGLSASFSSQSEDEAFEMPEDTFCESGFSEDLDLDISAMYIGDEEPDDSDTFLTEVHYKRDSKHPPPLTFNQNNGQTVISSRIPDVRPGSILVKVNSKYVLDLTPEEIKAECKAAAKQGHLLFLTLLCHAFEDSLLDPNQMVSNVTDTIL